MTTRVLIPRVNANDDQVLIVKLHIAAGDEVQEGDLLAEIETSKATSEILAPAAGRVGEIAFSEGEFADVEALLCSLSAAAAENVNREPLLGGEASGRKVTAKARRRAAELAVDVDDVPAEPDGRVTVAAVEAYAGSDSVKAPVVVSAVADRQKDDPMEIRSIGGKLDPDFKRTLSEEPTFAWLPSHEKVERYRAAGALIGDDVNLEPGSIIIADSIELADEVEVRAETRITAESLAIGRMSVIGPRSTVTCRHIRIGDMLYTASEITVGGTDSFSKTDKLIIGDLCLISTRCFLDTGNGIRLGNEVGISPFVKLYTHHYWQNVLEGYHANFGPIIIQDGAYITGDCLVTPGVEIGKGATILANSTVASNIEPYGIYSGNPARKIGMVERQLPIDRKERIVKRLLDQMSDSFAGRFAREEVTYQRSLDLTAVGSAKVILTFDCAGQEGAAESQGFVVFDLGQFKVVGHQTSASDEVRNFLRRRGIRLSPIHWRYRN